MTHGARATRASRTLKAMMPLVMVSRMGASHWCRTMTPHAGCSRLIEPGSSIVASSGARLINWVPIFINLTNWVAIFVCMWNCSVLVLKMCHFQGKKHELITKAMYSKQKPQD